MTPPVSPSPVDGPLAFALVYTLSVLLLVPASPLTLAAGALFGPLVGTLIVVAASNLGAASAFLIARHLAREALARRLLKNPKLKALDLAIARHGALVVALLRLSPAVPFNLQNYLYGLSAIPFWTCTLTSALAMLPGTILYVWLGHSARLGLEAASGTSPPRSPAQWSLLALGLLATLALSLLAAAWARRNLPQTLLNPTEPSHPHPGTPQPDSQTPRLP